MKQVHSSNFKLGILGGGQLGRMILQESPNLDVDVYTMDTDPDAPCAVSSNYSIGDITNYEDVINFGKDKDVLTIEIENVNVLALEELEKQGIKVFPQPKVIRIIQDKGLQKQFYIDNNIPTAPFHIIQNKSEILNHLNFLPVAQKLRVGGYDGKGVQILKNENDLVKAFDAPCVLEKLVDLDKELALIVARNESGEIKSFPLVELEFNPEANLVEFLFSPAKVSSAIEVEAEQIAKKIINELDMVGILAIEFFLSKKGDLLVNEVAPRPHNSGHQTIEGNYTSQFGQHLRAILNLPLGETKNRAASVMVNILGEPGFTGSPIYSGMNNLLAQPGVYPHIYGKKTTKPFRKMGHITIVNEDLEEAKKIALSAKNDLKVISES